MARATQIRLRSRWPVWFYVLILIPLGFGTSFAADHPGVFALVLSVFLITALLRWRALAHGIAPKDPEAAALWLRSHGRHSVAAAFLWGAFACYMQVAYRGDFLQFAVLLLTTGIVCYAVTSFSGDRKLTISYLVCAILPPLAGIASGADAPSAILAILMVLFLAAMTLQIMGLNDWFVRCTVESLLLEKSRKEAEASARVKSEFLANMSHELRTPMNGVMGMLELLLHSGLDRDQTLLARTSHRSAEALLEILNDILDFSKMSAGKLDFAREDFIVRNAIEDVFDLLASRASEKGLDLGYRIDAAVPDWVCGDEGRLRQVLMNLVGNAIKFSRGGDWPHGGGVFVEARLLSQSGEAVRLSFSVADEGMGMSPETLSKLFQPFMQADASTSRRFGGTGLGLAISRELVTAMGGSISAESEEHSGAKFTFDVALSAASNPHTVTPVTAVRCRILVIEPAPQSRAAIAGLIARHGASVTLAGTLAEAAQHLTAESFQCVIAGTGPGQSPAELRACLRTLLPSPPPPAFLLLHLGESADEAVTLTRPVRAAQIAEVLAEASCLPRSIAPAPARPPARLSGHVLIVEDNPVNQMLAVRLAAALGLTSEVAPDGQAALEAAAKQEFRLVLMDCQMPTMDGMRPPAACARALPPPESPSSP